MIRSRHLSVDVTAASGLGEPCQLGVTVYLPDPAALPDRPVVCFAFAGGNFNRLYYALDLPDSPVGGEAAFHTDRGWIFVAIDHLGTGTSSLPDGNRLTFDNIAAANASAVGTVLERLAAGLVADRYPHVRDAVSIGIGHSMGGGFLVVAQGQHAPFDGIGVLGCSAIHLTLPSPPGVPRQPMPWLLRGSTPADPIVLNQAELERGGRTVADAANRVFPAGVDPFTWAFHYDDVPADLVAQDRAGRTGGTVPPWRSTTVPPCVVSLNTPGAISGEAAAVTVPVLVACGERDMVPDPMLEPTAYKSSQDVSVFVCPRMAHMHNFATTRTVLWEHIHHWGEGVARSKLSYGSRSSAFR